jgi:hypothetical protein
MGESQGQKEFAGEVSSAAFFVRSGGAAQHFFQQDFLSS